MHFKLLFYCHQSLIANVNFFFALTNGCVSESEGGLSFLGVIFFFFFFSCGNRPGYLSFALEGKPQLLLLFREVTKRHDPPREGQILKKKSPFKRLALKD